ncbi:MAG TPA: shikimate dehydrogenase [Paracoccaceae bacterium]|nr:shikimate dehydrogenase [Paracoccaceae bacterium]
MSHESPPLAAVLGWPISHSKSPVLHGYWLKKYGITGYYIPIGVAPTDFEQALRSLPRLGFKGCNVTIPHKEKALTLADHVTDRAALIGAANTINFGADGTITADNTDGYGFLENLKQHAPSWNPASGPALVLGAGGASRAVISALLSAGVPEVRLANRTRNRADMLAEAFGANVRVIDWNKISDAADGAVTVVNTTAMGMAGNKDVAMRFDAAPSNALVTDIVYTPLETGFLRDAKNHGLQTVDGLGMLLHQAAPGFERWFGTHPEVDDGLRQAVLSA